MNKDAKILIVEDEQHINRLIELVLISGGYYKIYKAFNGKDALEKVKKEKPDLVLLDIMIPEIDGYSLAKIIKNDDNLNHIQIIMLTAKKMEEDILKGFETGAIDYISKPFSNKILLARVHAHLGNIKINNKKIYKNIELDDERKLVFVDAKDTSLTNFEYRILQIFMENPGIVFSRSKLLSYLRGDDGFNVSERAVDVQILNLRKKLGEYSSYIETIRAAGYKLKEI